MIEDHVERLAKRILENDALGVCHIDVVRMLAQKYLELLAEIKELRAGLHRRHTWDYES